MSKTITLYKYVSITHVVDNIENHRLYLDDGTNFNDPFEMSIYNPKTNSINKIKGLLVLCLTNSYRKN